MLTADNFRFARQAGATHIVAHWVDYFREGPRIPAAQSSGHGWGFSDNRGKLWTVEELTDLRKAVEAEGLILAAIENLDPSHWYDILLDGPEKANQLEDIKTIVRRMGEAGIPVLGYNFSIAGVWGHVVGPFARGGAESVGFSASTGPEETPIPNGQVWNLTYNADAPAGTIPPVTTEKLWANLTDFLQAVVPVAEEAGVRLAAHPDDPGPCPAGQSAPPLPEVARYLPQPRERPRVLPGNHRGDDHRRRLRGDRSVFEAGRDRVCPLPQRARQGAGVSRGLRRRGRHRHDQGPADLPSQRLRRRDGPR